MLQLISAALACFASSGASTEPQDVVRAWYDTIDDASDQARLVEYGNVGSGLAPLERAYEQLAPTLRAELPKEDFLMKYRGLAQLRVLQVHPIENERAPGNTEVFVEEERTMVIEGTPVLAWFKGTLELKNSAGTWQISGLKNLKPEDIISPLDGRTASQQDPEDVARAACQCGLAQQDCSIKTKALPPNTSKSLGKVTVQTHESTLVVSMARLHSGIWLALETKQETASPKK